LFANEKAFSTKCTKYTKKGFLEHRIGNFCFYFVTFVEIFLSLLLQQLQMR